jgi:hypothetical protein
MALKRLLDWLGKQKDGVVDLAMDAMEGIVESAMETGEWALGQGSPLEQIAASIAIIIFGVGTSWISLGATLAIAFGGVLTLLWGLGRLAYDFHTLVIRGDSR